MANIAELRQKNSTDLQKHIKKLNGKIAQITRDRFIKEQKNVRELRNIKRELARSLGINTEKERER